VNSWEIPGGFDHAGVTSGCVTCHNNGFVPGKGGNHIPSPEQCETCHDVNSWGIPGGFDHAGVTSGCASCHNGGFADGTPSGHFVTSLDCSECHNTRNWDGISFVHTSPTYPGNHQGGVGCTDCHRGNTEQATWTAGGLKPFCAGCHLGDFKPGPHKKTENPRKILYTVDEVADCTGACHVYRDDNFDQIEKNRSGEHRVNRGDW
jgi:hypothetical protein